MIELHAFLLAVPGLRGIRFRFSERRFLLHALPGAGFRSLLQLFMIDLFDLFHRKAAAAVIAKEPAGLAVIVKRTGAGRALIIGNL